MTGDLDLFRHFAGVGIEVITVASHEFLRKRENVAVETEKITNGVIVLEPVESPYLNPLVLRNYLRGFTEHGFQTGNQLVAPVIWNLGLSLGGHVVGIDSLNQLFE